MLLAYRITENEKPLRIMKNFNILWDFPVSKNGKAKFIFYVYQLFPWCFSFFIKANNNKGGIESCMK